MRILATTVLSLALALPVASQVQDTASADEADKVRDAISRVGCSAETVEKESDDLYEIDDAECEIGQYDIKLDGDFNIRAMIFDGPIDESGEEVEASQEETEMVIKAIEEFGCDVDQVEKESGNLLEVDDAACGSAQYDFILDGNGTVLAMTYDGDIDDDAAASSASGEQSSQGASNVTVDQEAIDAIGRMMVQIACQVEPENIEKTSEGYELDDVFCDDGQYDMVLDNNLSLVEKRKE